MGIGGQFPEVKCLLGLRHTHFTKAGALEGGSAYQAWNYVDIDTLIMGDTHDGPN